MNLRISPAFRDISTAGADAYLGIISPISRDPNRHRRRGNMNRRLPQRRNSTGRLPKMAICPANTNRAHHIRVASYRAAAR
ncbi:hypothetical protein KCP74_20620 [Salmonella enterica subsp. enterica]|nr:hypothetical protein KCP74_20620 [Salmonella enterica subsp. enterica]